MSELQVTVTSLQEQLGWGAGAAPCPPQEHMIWCVLIYGNIGWFDRFIYLYIMVQACNPPPPPPWWSWSGGSCVWRGCPTGICYPRPPCGCGKWVVVVVCLYSMYVPPGNGDGFEDDVHGGAVPQGYVTPAPPCGCGKGVVVVVCLYSMYVPPP